MKKLIYSLLLVAFLCSATGCKKFLNVPSLNDLSGNDYWKTKVDVEAFVGGIYSKLRSATMNKALFFPCTGDFRCAPVSLNSGSDFWDNQYISPLRSNDLRTLISQNRGLINQITKWDDFYFVIQECNILFDRMDKLEDGILNDTEKDAYRAESAFIRSFVYFLMMRIYGDVPYYIIPYNNVPLPRMPMVEVIKNCLEDLSVSKDWLPWTYGQEDKIAVRASRGSATILMMHFNMWLAGFDRDNRSEYYTDVAELGREMMESSNNAFELLPITRTKDIFHGRSREGIFEIVQNINKGEQFQSTATFADYVLQRPYKPYEAPKISYSSDFMNKIYPATEEDLRKTLWFDVSLNGLQQIMKFANSIQQDADDATQTDNMIVFRYADVVLLRAEALAELNRDEEALKIVNLIRERAGAGPFNTTGELLKDDIYWERVRELMGEGQYFYDLVRTQKAIDGNYSWSPLTSDNFRAGAWTWPIDVSALDDNPKMTLNNFWN